MNFKQFEADGLITPAMVKNEQHFWICDYRHNRDNVLDKAIRNVPPTKVVIVDNKDLPKGKRGYYSNFHFRPVGKDGRPNKRIIVPFDSTGYRGNTGTDVKIFYTEKECRDFYIGQCHAVRALIIESKKSMIERFDGMDAWLDSEIAKNTTP